MVDVLCAALSGGHWSGSISDDDRQGSVAQICHAFIVWRIDSFVDQERFLDGIAEMTSALRDIPTLPDADEDRVLIPGDPEHRAAIENAERGIPIRSSVVTELRQIADQLGVESPFG